jgi:NAD(P)-dependent dehydrogenase (short-subunit alcohol dehydrogenase family)
VSNRVAAVQLDVTDRAAFVRAADEAEAAFGNIHVVCNNAGVTHRGPIESASYDDWDWVLGVNLGGVVNGVHTFVPRIKKHGEGGHIVNTASMAGLMSAEGNGIYITSKFAVVGLSETLQKELARYDIGVSVLCPGAVKTGINEAERNRPDALGEVGRKMTDDEMVLMRKAFEGGSTPREMGDAVVAAIKSNTLYILPHAEFKDGFQKKVEEILASFTDEPPNPERVAGNKYRNESFASFWKDTDVG